ncbi:unnamed protein product [Discosporangium mesarthrocarpum]
MCSGVLTCLVFRCPVLSVFVFLFSSCGLIRRAPHGNVSLFLRVLLSTKACNFFEVQHRHTLHFRVSNRIGSGFSIHSKVLCVLPIECCIALLSMASFGCLPCCLVLQTPRVSSLYRLHDVIHRSRMCGFALETF